MSSNNPEDLIAEEFDLEADPLVEYNRKMQKFDVDWYDHYLREYVEHKDIKDSYKEHYERAFDDFKEFMASHAPERNPTLANEDHIEARLDDMLPRMSGGVARAKINHIKEVYEWMQLSNKFPHPTTYNPFLIIKEKREADLKEKDVNDYPNLGLDDIKRQVEGIKHIGERAVTVFQLKTGIRSSELENIRFEDVHITNADVMEHYDRMGSSDQLDGYANAVYIPHDTVRDGNKRERPTVIPLDDETRRVLIDWLLIRPDNGDPHVFLTQKGGPMRPNNLYHVWRKHWHPEYEFNDDADVRTISPHYARHWFSSWFRHAGLSEPQIQYLRGDVMGPEIGTSRSAMHRYIHTHYEQVEDAYRENVFKLGI